VGNYNPSYPLTLKKPLFLISSIENKAEQDKVIETKEGRNCKYCGEFIEGNHGDYLVHVRKCIKRTEGK
jgi:hypothetical protein